MEEERAELRTLLATYAEGSEEWYDVKKQEWEMTHAIQEANTNIEKTKKDKIAADIDYLDKFYSHNLDNLDDRLTYIDNDISRREALYQKPTIGHYKQKKEISEDQLVYYTSQKENLTALLATIPKYTEQWKEVTQQIWEAEHGMQDAVIRIAESSKEIIEIYNSIFTEIGEMYDSKLSISDDKIASMQNYAEILELQGKTANKGLYDAMIAETEKSKETKWAKFNEQQKVVEELKALENTEEANTPEWEAFERARNEGIVAAREEMRQLKLDIQEDEKAVIQLQEEFKELATQRWDDIRDAYDNRNTYYENQVSLVDKYIDKLDTFGINIPVELYESQIESLKSLNENQWNDYTQARQQMGEYEKIYGADSQEYIDKYFEVVELHQAYLDGQNEILEKQHQIIENQWDRFDQVMDRVNNSINRLQNISELISDEDVATEDGEWTAEGLTQLGLAYQQMEYNKQSTKEYAAEI
jgi:hypothetical protein